MSSTATEQPNRGVIAFATTLGALLALIILCIADSYRISPAPVPLLMKALLALIAIANALSFVVAIPAAFHGRRFGSSAVGLSLLQLLFLAFIWWVGIA